MVCKKQNKSNVPLSRLRHNCNCLKGCRHPKTNERVIDSSEVPLDIVAQSANILVNAQQIQVLQLVWPDGHETEYDQVFLEENAYAKNRKIIASIPNDNNNIRVDYLELLNKYDNGNGQLNAQGQIAYRELCNEKLVKYGAILVRNRGLDADKIIDDFLPQGKDVIHTHFGRIEDLRKDNSTNQNNDQLGYTDAEVSVE